MRFSTVLFVDSVSYVTAVKKDTCTVAASVLYKYTDTFKIPKASIKNPPHMCQFLRLLSIFSLAVCLWFYPRLNQNLIFSFALCQVYKYVDRVFWERNLQSQIRITFSMKLVFWFAIEWNFTTTLIFVELIQFADLKVFRFAFKLLLLSYPLVKLVHIPLAKIGFLFFEYRFEIYIFPK